MYYFHDYTLLCIETKLTVIHSFSFKIYNSTDTCCISAQLKENSACNAWVIPAHKTEVLLQSQCQNKTENRLSETHKTHLKSQGGSNLSTASLQDTKMKV